MPLVINCSGKRNWWDTTLATACLESVTKRVIGVVPFTPSRGVTTVEMNFQWELISQSVTIHFKIIYFLSNVTGPKHSREGKHCIINRGEKGQIWRCRHNYGDVRWNDFGSVSVKRNWNFRFIGLFSDALLFSWWWWGGGGGYFSKPDKCLWNCPYPWSFCNNLSKTRSVLYTLF